MSFNDKLSRLFTNFKVSKPNNISKYKHYLYADYVELIALFSNEDITTPTDILDRLYDEEVVINEVDDGDSDEIGSGESDRNDKNESWIREIFDVISSRDISFAENYPFDISASGIKLKGTISIKNKLYLNLLIASSLNYFSEVKHELTSEFETISYQAIKNYLPSIAKVKQFGKNSDYTGTAKNKILNLADDMNIKIHNDVIDKVMGNQEKGLDLIAWLPFDDEVPNMLVILVQCACGSEWDKKQSETTRYEKYYRFETLKPIHSMFIPYSITEDSQNFYQLEDIENKLLFERKRILDYITDTSFYETTDSIKIIDKSVEYQEDVV